MKKSPHFRERKSRGRMVHQCVQTRTERMVSLCLLHGSWYRRHRSNGMRFHTFTQTHHPLGAVPSLPCVFMDPPKTAKTSNPALAPIAWNLALGFCEEHTTLVEDQPRHFLPTVLNLRDMFWWLDRMTGTSTHSIRALRRSQATASLAPRCPCHVRLEAGQRHFLRYRASCHLFFRPLYSPPHSNI